jgi:hypothetical protein
MTAFGVIIPTKDGLLCHGGINLPDSRYALKTVSLLNWSSLSNDNDPVKSITPQGFKNGPPTGLSHHAGCLLHDGDVVLLIGGKNGSRRTNKVYALDLVRKRWIPMQECLERSGKDTPEGLTGHTATRINDQLICVLGRQLDGVQVQSKFSELYYLHVNIFNGTYFYQNSKLQPSSRSGHTTVLVRGIRRPPGFQRFNFGLLNFGGSSSGEVEMCGQFSSEDVKDIDIFYDEINRTRLKSAILLSMNRVSYTMIILILYVSTYRTNTSFFENT